MPVVRDTDVVLAYDRAGSGRAVVLIHGTGSSRAVWRPVVERLSRSRECWSIDLPGFGESEPLAAGTPVAAQQLADAVVTWMDAVGLDRPAVIGNSLGGWIAFELARRRRASSVCAFGPAGIWKRRASFLTRLALHADYRGARLLRPVIPLLSRSILGRTLLLASVAARPRRWPPAAVEDAADAMANARSFLPSMRVTPYDRFRGGRDIDVPVTVVFMSRDLMVRERGSSLVELPVHTRVVRMARSGHVPFYDDPDGATQVILDVSSHNS